MRRWGARRPAVTLRTLGAGRRKGYEAERHGYDSSTYMVVPNGTACQRRVTLTRGQGRRLGGEARRGALRRRPDGARLGGLGGFRRAVYGSARGSEGSASAAPPAAKAGGWAGKRAEARCAGAGGEPASAGGGLRRAVYGSALQAAARGTLLRGLHPRPRPAAGREARRGALRRRPDGARRGGLGGFRRAVYGSALQAAARGTLLRGLHPRPRPAAGWTSAPRRAARASGGARLGGLGGLRRAVYGSAFQAAGAA